MRYAPSLPPLVTGLEDKWKIKGLAETRMAKVVHEHVSPLLEPQQHPQPEPLSAKTRQPGKHHAGHYQERRMYCRRINRQPILIEFRSGKERRKHNQGKSGVAEHIDEEV